MKYTLPAALLAPFIVISPLHAETNTLKFDRNGRTETYKTDTASGTLEIEWSKTLKVFQDVVGSSGETYRSLVHFNGGPALTYENAASSTSFEIYYTLEIKGNTPVIDCLYGNIRNAQNGASIRKAVCNLDKPLSSDYQDLVFAYSDKWISESNTTNLQPVMADPPKSVSAPVGSLGEIKTTLHYGSADELMSATPHTLAIAGNKTYDLGAGNVYFVYDVDGITPLGLDLETATEAHTMERIREAELLQTINTN